MKRQENVLAKSTLYCITSIVAAYSCFALHVPEFIFSLFEMNVCSSISKVKNYNTVPPRILDK